MTNQEILAQARNAVLDNKISWQDYDALTLSLALSDGRRIDYYEYIASAEWKQKADTAKKAAGYRCQVCNKSKDEGAMLDAHHRTYERLGHERPEDVTVLCRDCHSLFEENKRNE